MARAATVPVPAILAPGQIFCPVGRALDVIGDRWTLVLIRHLLGGPRGFQELRVRTGIAPRVLSGRLRDLIERGIVETTGSAARSPYQMTESGRALEPVIAAVARWYLRHGLADLQVDVGRFSATSAQSIIETLPFLLYEERAAGVDLTFEIRLTGLGGGVWTLHIADGTCTVSQGFASRADVRYTADARLWCGVALGIADARQLYQRGLMTKEGGREAMDYYFHQIAPAPATKGRELSGSPRRPAHAERSNGARKIRRPR